MPCSLLFKFLWFWNYGYYWCEFFMFHWVFPLIYFSFAFCVPFFRCYFLSLGLGCVCVHYIYVLSQLLKDMYVISDSGLLRMVFCDSLLHVFLWIHVCISVWYVPRNRVAWPKDEHMFNFGECWQAVFQNGCTNICSCQQFQWLSILSNALYFPSFSF